ncbi:phospholipase D-like domain-containing protein [Draconibacterium sp.]|uniref:phospholipase D-like domain-containing protein n=1 Tax=Draconibacterium sp. TaxID=1965318 RepID=UPI0035662E63
MQTEAIFENIAGQIQQEIEKAQQSVFIAVAWFTNKALFNTLLNRAKDGCRVSLIISNDEINQNSPVDFELLNMNGSVVYKIGDGDSVLMHNKFCVIDHSTIITGSYNWSYKAESNFENVVITRNDTMLAEQFIAEFNKIRKQFFQDEPSENYFPVDKIVQRLEILKNYILLEDTEELKREVSKLQNYRFNTDISEIVGDVNGKEYAAAIKKIQQFISGNQQLLVWTDPEIEALKLEIKNLENQLNAFDNEKTELEKILSEFQHRHSGELGELILEILKLRKLRYKSDKTKYEEAANDEKEYRAQFEKEKKRQVFDLNDEEKANLKKKFRKATVLCHPDKVSDEFKEAAQQMFIELKTAYDANDVKKVSEILNDLENGNYFKAKSETITQKDVLRSAIAQLCRQIKQLEDEIIYIKQSETFKTVSSITNWDEYFIITKEKLQEELESLKIEA